MPVLFSKKDFKGEFVLKEDGNQTGERVVDKKVLTENIIVNDSFPQNPDIKLSNKEQSPNLESNNSDNKKTSLIDKISEGSKPHFFSSLCIYPGAVAFKDQEMDEKIIVLVRRHFITNISWILVSIIFAILPLIILPLTSVIVPFLDISNQTKIVSTMFYYLLVFGYMLLNFSIWYFHVALITNRRIVDVDLSGILYRNVAETKLDLVQDVSYTQNGVIRSIFNYGDVVVQTAGNLPNFEFDKAPKPDKIMDIVGDLIGRRHKKMA